MPSLRGSLLKDASFSLTIEVFSLTSPLFEIITFPDSNTFQDGNGNGNLGEINSNYFQDGNWESMEMKV